MIREAKRVVAKIRTEASVPTNTAVSTIMAAAVVVCHRWND
jgi:hypothetical protein